MPFSPDVIADQLAEARRAIAQVAPFDAEIAPTNLADGYEAQAALHERCSTIGWKIGCTTKTMQDILGVPHPAAGGIPADMVFEDEAALNARDFTKPGVELELAVRLSQDVPARDTDWTRDTISDHVGSVILAFEIVENRFADIHAMGTPTLIANDFFGRGIVLGQEREDWHSLDLAALEGIKTLNGEEFGRATGAEVMGHPLEALAWLANMAPEHGIGLKAGQVVLLGSLVPAYWLQQGDQITGEVDGFGQVHLKLT